MFEDGEGTAGGGNDGAPDAGTTAAASEPAGGPATAAPAPPDPAALAPAAGAPAAPSAPAQPAIDVAAIDAETHPSAPATPAERSATWDKLIAALGDVPDAPNDRLLDGIDEKVVGRLPAESKALLRHLLAQRAVDRKANAEAAAAAQKVLDDRAAKLDQDARAMLDREAQFAALFNSPRFKDLLAKADDQTDVDPLSSEGQRILVERNTAKAFKEFTEPFLQDTRTVQARANYHKFVDEHPRMKDAAFKTEVTALVKKRQAAGTPIQLPDAHDLVEQRLLLREDTARREADRKAREASMAQVGRRGASAQPDQGGPIPESVHKDGYNGHRGAAAVYHYLKDHPDAVKAVNRDRTSRRASASA